MERRAQDVDVVDDVVLDDGEADAEGVGEDRLEERLALRFGELLRVVQARECDRAGVGERAGGGDDGAGERPASGLVEADQQG